MTPCHSSDTLTHMHQTDSQASREKKAAGGRVNVVNAWLCS